MLKTISIEEYRRIGVKTPADMIHPSKINGTNKYISKDIKNLFKKSIKTQRKLYDELADENNYYLFDHSCGMDLKYFNRSKFDVPLLFAFPYGFFHKSEINHTKFPNCKVYLVNPKLLFYHESAESIVYVRNYDVFFGEGATDNLVSKINDWVRLHSDLDEDLIFKWSNL